jgi:acetoin utilization deacetylase AcuC-like enzyme
LKAFYHKNQNKHSPKFYIKHGKPTPAKEIPEREDVFIKVINELNIPLEEANDFGMSFISAVHTPNYLFFLKTIYPKWALLSEPSSEIFPESHPVKHTPSYPKDTIGQIGWHIMDLSCPIGEESWLGAYASAQTAISAADCIATGKSSTAYAACRPPGHHAHSDAAAGFCILNNSAIAAERLLKDFDRVAILDVDLHHGNGTQAIFWNRRDVMTISIHADPAICYPHFWGYEHEKGEGQGYGFNINYPIPEGTSDNDYMSVLEKAIDQLKAYSPDVIILALGLDASEQDPIDMLGLTTAGFSEIGQRVKALNLPILIVQEGGYISPILGDNLAALLKAFINE